MNKIIMIADCSGGADDYVDSLTIIEYQNKKDLNQQLKKEWEEDYDYAIDDYFYFNVDSLEIAEKYLAVHNEEIEGDTDGWRWSCDFDMLKYKPSDVLWKTDFELKLNTLI